MAGGRPPLPNKVKDLRGTLKPERVKPGEPKPTRGVPRCPAFLDRSAKAKWKEVSAELDRLGLLTVVDGDALACYCQAWSEFEWATKELRKGRTVERGTGAMAPHPAVAMQRSAWKAVKDFAALFGLDPSSRGKLSVPDGAAESPLQQLRLMAQGGEN